jgi:ssDNA-binding Zn-finger/Zn-ribbon topoisomerase 1
MGGENLMKADITFIPVDSENPASEIARDFWAGEVTVEPPTYHHGFRTTVTFKFTQKLLCEKHGIEHPHKLRETISPLGFPVLPNPYCRSCGFEFDVSPCRFDSRAEFTDYVDRWANANCQECSKKIALQRAEEDRVRGEIEAANAQRRQEELEAHKEKLRAKYGSRYVEDCPSCGSGVLYFRQGKYPGSVFIGCSSWPRCEYRRSNAAPLPPQPVEEIQKLKAILADAPKCPRCGAPLTQRQGKYGPFIGCTAFPHCTYSDNIITPSAS